MIKANKCEADADAMSKEGEIWRKMKKKTADLYYPSIYDGSKKLG